jgi:hypothetical protein
VIVEATVPGTPLPSFERWEPFIVKSGYRMVYFDGLNRFYLSKEKQKLAERFALPPNIWDEYVPASQLAQQERIAVLEAQVAQLTDEITAQRRPGDS